MRRINVFLCCFLLFIFSSFSAFAYNGDTVVYVTKTGECYHESGCSYLNSRIEKTLEEASLWYRPCSKCKPPVLTKDVELLEIADKLEEWNAYRSVASDPSSPEQTISQLEEKNKILEKRNTEYRHENLELIKEVIELKETVAFYEEQGIGYDSEDVLTYAAASFGAGIFLPRLFRKRK